MVPMRPQWLRAPVIFLTAAAITVLADPLAARAGDYGAVTSGNWNSSSTWTPSGIPGPSDRALIGSTIPSGAAATATVILTQNQQANHVELGRGAGTSGTLDLGNFNLIANALTLGDNGGTGAITRGTGFFDVANLRLSNSSLSMSASDRAHSLYLNDDDGSAIVSTAAVGNVTRWVSVGSGSTLTLGADLSVELDVNVQGNNSTLDAQGHRIIAGQLSLGYGGTNVQLLNRGDLTLSDLSVHNQNLNLRAADVVRTFQLHNGGTTFATDPAATVDRLLLFDGSAAWTAAMGNVTEWVQVESGSRLTLGADLSLSTVNVQGNNSALDAQGHKITAFALRLGYGGGTNVQLLNRGDLTVNELYVSNQGLNLRASDTVTTYYLSNGGTTFAPGAVVQSLYLSNGATATTAAAGNITSTIKVESGSTLTLGSDLSVTGLVDVSGTNSTLNAQGHKITAGTLNLVAGTNAQLQNKGDLAVGNLSVSSMNLHLSATDTVTNSVRVYTNGTVTLGADLSVTGLVDIAFDNSTLDAQGHRITAGSLYLGYNGGSNVQLLNRGDLAVGNLFLRNVNLTLGAADTVTNSIKVHDSGTLTLGADLSVTGSVEVAWGSSTLDAQGHNITADTLFVGYPAGTRAKLLNDGAITVANWYQDNSTRVELNDGNDAVQFLSLSGFSNLTVKSALTGLTLDGASADSLSLNNISPGTLTLELNGLQAGWVFRWANPDGGDHIADLNALIGQDRIQFSLSNGAQYEIVSQGGYTYIVQPVPEPGSVLLIAAPVAVGVCLRRRNRSSALATARNCFHPFRKPVT
jgi:hypothetical protein